MREADVIKHYITPLSRPHGRDKLDREFLRRVQRDVDSDPVTIVYVTLETEDEN
jgi:formylmethanofuran:tetrahydromethanopterin formyltransferase